MIRRSQISREHDLQFSELLAATAPRRVPDFNADLVVSMPERRGGSLPDHLLELAIRPAAADAGRAVRQPHALEGNRRM